MYFVGAMTVITAIIYFSPWDMPSSMALIISLTAAMGAGTHFGKEQNRLPEKSEKRKIAFAGAVISTFLPMLLFWIFLLIVGATWADAIPELANVPRLFWIGAIAVTLLISFAVIYFAFGWGAKNHFKALEKKMGKSN